MTPVRTISCPALALALTLACGPDPAPGEGGTTTTTNASTSTDDATDDATTDASDDATTDTDDDTTDNGSTTAPSADFGDSVSECDPWAQDCPRGEKCVPYDSDGGSTWDAWKCVPIQGDHAPGEPCVSDGIEEATDNCDATSYCFYLEEVGDQLEGTCLALCTGTPQMPECPPMSACSITGEGSLLVCIPTCDPLTQEDCPDEDLACHYANNGFSCVPQGGAIPPGESCGFVNVCEPGNFCVDINVVPMCEGEDAGCCTPYCDLSDPGSACDAVPGTQCVAFYEEGEAPEGYENVGVCVVP